MSQAKPFEMALIVLASIILVVAATYHLRESPAIWYDEGYYTQVAMNMARFGEQALQVAPSQFVSTAYVTVGYPLLFPVSLSYRIFGVGVLQGRAVMVLFILGLATVSFFFIRALYGTRPAAFSLLLLATLPTLYGNGKSVLGEVPGLFYLVAALWALVVLERDRWRSLSLYAVVGLFAGLCAVTKPIYVFFPLALLIALLIRVRSIELNWRGFFLGLLTLLLPILLWLYLQFGSDTSLRSILGYYANPYGVSNVWLLILTNIKRFLTEVTPLYTLILVAVWGAGLWVLRRIRVLSMAEWAALIFTLLIMVDYLRIAEWYRYLFPATLMALIFFAPATITFYDVLSVRMVVLRRIAWLPFALLILLASLQLYQTAFSSYVAGYYSSTKVAALQEAFAQFPQNTSVFLYDVPEVAVLLPSSAYYQYLHPQPNLEIGQQELSVLAQGTADIVIVDGDTYAADPGAFSAYQISAEANHYVILKKR